MFGLNELRGEVCLLVARGSKLCRLYSPLLLYMIKNDYRFCAGSESDQHLDTIHSDQHES